VNLVPVAHQGKDEQNQRDQKQAGGLGGVHSLAVMPVSGLAVDAFGLDCGGRHAAIVAPEKSKSRHQL
jgi:hypothetical protein